jgi:lipid-binding SYLF domain-containing protein
MLVFPNIVKAGFIVCGQYGDGSLLEASRRTVYFRSLAGSFGLQAGAQSYGYGLFFRDNSSPRYLRLHICQKGLMAGIGIQGSKITRIHPTS